METGVSAATDAAPARRDGLALLGQGFALASVKRAIAWVVLFVVKVEAVRSVQLRLRLDR